jgi:hypothetical protein
MEIKHFYSQILERFLDIKCIVVYIGEFFLIKIFSHIIR